MLIRQTLIKQGVIFIVYARTIAKATAVITLYLAIDLGPCFVSVTDHICTLLPYLTIELSVVLVYEKRTLAYTKP